MKNSEKHLQYCAMNSANEIQLQCAGGYSFITLSQRVLETLSSIPERLSHVQQQASSCSLLLLLLISHLC